MFWVYVRFFWEGKQFGCNFNENLLTSIKHVAFFSITSWDLLALFTICLIVNLEHVILFTCFQDRLATLWLFFYSYVMLLHFVPNCIWKPFPLLLLHYLLYINQHEINNISRRPPCRFLNVNGQSFRNRHSTLQPAFCK